MLGIVIIGRNEGERLRRCLSSAFDLENPAALRKVVYVDSGSTDQSVELAKSVGASVVNLDLTIPFTAARARNAGFQRLAQESPNLEHVQFIDGDCELHPGWLSAAQTFLNSHPRAAVVCGRRRERFPRHSVYNSLCDQEWNTPIGKADACGGDALMRVDALRSVGRYDDRLIAGEEPELCVRLRQAGWEIWRIDQEMTWHDASMTHFSQWWKRNLRSGHAYAEVNSMHGAPPERFWAKEVRSNWFWGAIWLIPPLWPLLLYLFWRVKKYRLARGDDTRAAGQYAWFVILGKIPQMLGQLQFHWNRLRGKQSKLIEYKTAANELSRQE